MNGKNIPLDGREAEKSHAIVQHNSGSIVQGHTGLLQLRVAADDLQVVVAAADGVCHAEQISEDSGGLKRLEGVLEDVRPLGEVADNVDGMLLLEKGQVGRVELLIGDVGFSPNGTETRVRVLQVGAGITLKGRHDVHVELVVVDPSIALSASSGSVDAHTQNKPLASHILDHDTADAENVGNAVGVLDLRILVFVSPHHFVHMLPNITEDVVQA